VETITKKEIPASQRFLVFEIIANDPDTGDEVEVPYVRFRL
jgi:ubiquitin-activating enzyme E1